MGSCTNCIGTICIGTNCIGTNCIRNKLYWEQTVSGTYCIRNILYREHIVSGTNCIGNKLYRVQFVSGTNCIGSLSFFLPFHFLIFSKSKINCSIVSGVICDDFSWKKICMNKKISFAIWRLFSSLPNVFYGHDMAINSLYKIKIQFQFVVRI